MYPNMPCDDVLDFVRCNERAAEVRQRHVRHQPLDRQAVTRVLYMGCVSNTEH